MYFHCLTAAIADSLNIGLLDASTLTSTDVAVGLHDGLERDLAFDAGAPRDVGVRRLHLLDQDREHDVAGREDRDLVRPALDATKTPPTTPPTTPPGHPRGTAGDAPFDAEVFPGVIDRLDLLGGLLRLNDFVGL